MMADNAPTDLARWLDDMRSYWIEAELDAAYAFSMAQTKRGPIPQKTRRRALIVLTRNLVRTSDRIPELTQWLDATTPHDHVVREILTRILNAEANWRKTLNLVRATPVVFDIPDRRAITSPSDLPGWLIRLDEWATPESEIMDDLRHSITAHDSRADEALDHVQWTAEDDIEAIELVLSRAKGWSLPVESMKLLEDGSAAARTQLRDLLALVDKARPYSSSMKVAQDLAAISRREGALN